MSAKITEIQELGAEDTVQRYWTCTVPKVPHQLGNPCLIWNVMYFHHLNYVFWRVQKPSFTTVQVNRYNQSM